MSRRNMLTPLTIFESVLKYLQATKLLHVYKPSINTALNGYDVK